MNAACLAASGGAVADGTTAAAVLGSRQQVQQVQTHCV